MTTNILNIPVITLDIETVTNADWLDGIIYFEQDGTTPVDLTGIEFEMEMRFAPQDNTVVLRAATDNGLILVYQNSWQFIVPAEIMETIPPGPFIFDMLAIADGYTRNIAQATVTLDQGVTR